MWVNVEPESYYSFRLSSAFAVNEIAMAIFFAVIMKEVVEATAPGGVLHPWRRVALAVVVAVGAAAVPALLHTAIVEALDEPMLDDVGWPITFGADLAVMYFFARLIFRRHPMVPLLMLLGIASNAAGFVVLAMLYPTREPQAIIGFMSLVIGVAVACSFAIVGSAAFGHI